MGWEGGLRAVNKGTQYHHYRAGHTYFSMIKDNVISCFFLKGGDNMWENFYLI